MVVASAEPLLVGGQDERYRDGGRDEHQHGQTDADPQGEAVWSLRGRERGFGWGYVLCARRAAGRRGRRRGGAGYRAGTLPDGRSLLRWGRRTLAQNRSPLGDWTVA